MSEIPGQSKTKIEDFDTSGKTMAIVVMIVMTVCVVIMGYCSFCL